MIKEMLAQQAIMLQGIAGIYQNIRILTENMLGDDLGPASNIAHPE